MFEFKRNDVDIQSDEYVYRDYLRIRRLKLRHRTFAGGWTPVIQRDYFERARKQVAALLPYDPRTRKVVLIEQFRIGALDDNVSPWLLEIVAGLMEKDETPEELARREAKEEAGLKITRCKLCSHYFTAPGRSNERVNIFCGEIDIQQVKDGSIHGIAHEHEDIRTHILTADDAFTAVQDGRVKNAISIIAIQWLQIHEKELQKEWVQ